MGPIRRSLRLWLVVPRPGRVIRRSWSWEPLGRVRQLDWIPTLGVAQEGVPTHESLQRAMTPGRLSPEYPHRRRVVRSLSQQVLLPEGQVRAEHELRRSAQIVWRRRV